MIFQRLLLPLDLSDAGAEPARHARLLAEHFGAALHLLHVITDRESRPTAEADLQAWADAHDLADAELHVALAEAPAPGVHSFANEHGVDLIVMGTHGRRGLSRMFLGSVTEEVLREATCPVLTVRTDVDATAQLPVDSVLAPVDLSEASLHALPHARTFAAVYEARVDVLHVVEDIDIPAIYGEDIQNPLHDLYPEVKERTRGELEHALDAAAGPDVPSAIHFAHGHATDAIVDFAEEHGSDLIVLTRTGRRGITRLLLGSTSDGVLRTAPCPVLILPTTDE